MRKFIALFFIYSLTNTSLFAQDLKYYLPDSISYNPSIPKPKDIIHHEVGEWHVTHDRLVNYMQAIAKAAPDRVKMEMMGYTYENRPQVLLIITSPKNHQNLEQIRQQHIQLTDPSRSSSLNTANMPIVVYIGHSIHGNESSGANASLLSAYYLAAGQGRQIDELLDNVVVLFDPSFNPDGLQRFSTWANQHKSKNLVSDPNSREFNEVWPGGRFNHYWFDLNRDWLPAVHVESQNRLKWFHQWKPNILTDHHEQGSNATFFFQPGVPSRVNPLTPDKNQELTAKLGKFHAAFLDRIGSLYFTKENYDDFYYGKGSTYPDIQGCIGILFEQASSRGHAQQTNNGLLTFPFTIKNQFITTLSTLEGAKVMRKEFLSFQREFYKNAMAEASANTVKAYVFGSNNDQHTVEEFITMLKRHQIEVYNFKNPLNVSGNKYSPAGSYIVPLEQPQFKLIKTIFDKQLNFKDSLFYDITSWTMPLAFGLKSDELTASQLNQSSSYKGSNQVLTNKLDPNPDFAYLIEWKGLKVPAAVYEILNSGILAKVATNKFEVKIGNVDRKFDYGTIMIPIQMQNKSRDQILSIIQDVMAKYSVSIYDLESGVTMSGSDFGSSKFIALTKPSIAMITGPGVNATDAGEIWHLLDQRMNIPITHLEPVVFNRVELNKYNTIILVGGNYPDLNKDKLKTWVQGGGTLILTEEAVSWAAQSGINTASFKRLKSPVDSTQKLIYTDREQIDGAQQMHGAIFGAEVDLAHPLAYGYNEKTVSLFKGNKVFLEKSKNPYATPFYYKDKPLQSGWISRENYDAIKNSAAVTVNTVGNGRVINIADNPNFRAFWLGGSKLFMNAIFFGRIIDAASARTDE